MSGVRRDYAALAARLSPAGTRVERMRAAVNVLWEALAPTGVSWVGFYTVADGAAEMLLGPRRDKPACSPIGLQGACGEAFLTRRAVVVRDVRERGANYIACDPRDQSEVVVPCLAADGACWGVLDLDSYDVGAFVVADAAGLTRVLQAAGLTAP